MPGWTKRRPLGENGGHGDRMAPSAELAQLARFSHSVIQTFATHQGRHVTSFRGGFMYDRKHMDSDALKVMSKIAKLDLAYKTIRHLPEEFCTVLCTDLDAALLRIRRPGGPAAPSTVATRPVVEQRERLASPTSAQIEGRHVTTHVAFNKLAPAFVPGGAAEVAPSVFSIPAVLQSAQQSYDSQLNAHAALVEAQDSSLGTLIKEKEELRAQVRADVPARRRKMEVLEEKMRG
ncbi:unnamed protein product [Prorocentrum cordatum]|uniref:Uncharacterized protein n=1 Tax=Prorocentrum cordatum TaxID=2364126 RepID=A0ABN9UTI7_9DINO|nr:unnamed protein product [Polarella glacialis]